MSDEEYILLQDNRQKKSAGRGAYHKKGGSKSKGCRLPSDRLTAAQKKKLNGEVMTVQLYEKMTWKEFKSKPRDVQRLYIALLHDEHGARQKDIAELMGVSIKTLNTYIKTHIPGHKWISHKYPSEKWLKYLEEVAKRENGSADIEEEPVAEKSIVSEVITEREPNQNNKKEVEQALLRVENGHVRMTGNAEAIFTKMLLMFDSSKNYDITIVFVEVDKYAERTT